MNVDHPRERMNNGSRGFQPTEVGPSQELDTGRYTPDEFDESDWSIVEEVKRTGVVLWPVP